MVVFFKTFAIFLASSVFVVYIWWLLAEDDIDFDENHAKWVVFGCLGVWVFGGSHCRVFGYTSFERTFSSNQLV